jgi:hypothetical protein
MVKRPGREADHSPPSSAEVMNDGAILPLPHMPSWHSAQLINHMDNFTLPISYFLIDYLNSRSAFETATFSRPKSPLVHIRENSRNVEFTPSQKLWVLKIVKTKL